MKKLIIATSLVTALAGCQSTQTVQQAHDVNVCTFDDGSNASAPGWVCSQPFSDLKIQAVGEAAKTAGGKSIMRKRATAMARAELAESIKVDIDQLFEDAVKEVINNTQDREVASQVSESTAGASNITRTIVSRTLTDSRIAITTTSPKGTLYVLVGMDEAAYEANRVKIIDELASEDSALWDQFNNEQAAAELSDALHNLTR